MLLLLWLLLLMLWLLLLMLLLLLLLLLLLQLLLLLLELHILLLAACLLQCQVTRGSAEGAAALLQQLQFIVICVEHLQQHVSELAAPGTARHAFITE